MFCQSQRKLFFLFFGVIWMPILGDCQPVPVGTWPNVTGGVFNGPASQGLTLNAGQTINVTGGLTIISDDDLVIKGRIDLPVAAPLGSGGVNLTLMSRHGKVLVDDGAYVGGGSDDVGNGGKITFDGILVEMRGIVVGNRGGLPPGSTLNGSVGKPGGNGGDIVLIGVDGISIGKIGRKPKFFCVKAGEGGQGEGVDVTGSNDTTATGGIGGKGGDVIFKVRPNSGPKKVIVSILDKVAGGKGGMGGVAFANSTSAAKGGNATATAGKGGPGGTVVFPSALVDPPPAGGMVAGGNGGAGLAANATGGNGANASALSGNDGGDATAAGGKGGPPGFAPIIPLLSGSTQYGPAGVGGSGGDATANSGSGGNGTTWTIPKIITITTNGGSSGIATVTGGPNGAAKKAPIVAPNGPATTKVITGAAGVTNFAAGEP